MGMSWLGDEVKLISEDLVITSVILLHERLKRR